MNLSLKRQNYAPLLPFIQPPQIQVMCLFGCFYDNLLTPTGFAETQIREREVSPAAAKPASNIVTLPPFVPQSAILHHQV